MKISSTPPANSIFDALSLTSPSTNAASETTLPASSSVGSVNLSDPAKLFAELNQVSKSNPTEFKKITSQIASELQEAATKATDSNQAALLNQLASNFSKASQSGKFSDLLPHNPAAALHTSSTHHGHHGHKNDGDRDDIGQIFSKALAQIQTDLSSSTTSTNTAAS